MLPKLRTYLSLVWRKVSVPAPLSPESELRLLRCLGTVAAVCLGYCAASISIVGARSPLSSGAGTHVGLAALAVVAAIVAILALRPICEHLSALYRLAEDGGAPSAGPRRSWFSAAACLSRWAARLLPIPILAYIAGLAPRWWAEPGLFAATSACMLAVGWVRCLHYLVGIAARRDLRTGPLRSWRWLQPSVGPPGYGRRRAMARRAAWLALGASLVAALLTSPQPILVFLNEQDQFGRLFGNMSRVVHGAPWLHWGCIVPWQELGLVTALWVLYMLRAPVIPRSRQTWGAWMVALRRRDAARLAAMLAIGVYIPFGGWLPGLAGRLVPDLPLWLAGLGVIATVELAVRVTREVGLPRLARICITVILAAAAAGSLVALRDAASGITWAVADHVAGALGLLGHLPGDIGPVTERAIVAFAAAFLVCRLWVLARTCEAVQRIGAGVDARLRRAPQAGWARARALARAPAGERMHHRAWRWLWDPPSELSRWPEKRFRLVMLGLMVGGLLFMLQGGPHSIGMTSSVGLGDGVVRTGNNLGPWFDLVQIDFIGFPWWQRGEGRGSIDWWASWVTPRSPFSLLIWLAWAILSAGGIAQVLRWLRRLPVFLSAPAPEGDEATHPWPHIAQACRRHRDVALLAFVCMACGAWGILWHVGDRPRAVRLLVALCFAGYPWYLLAGLLETLRVLRQFAMRIVPSECRAPASSDAEVLLWVFRAALTGALGVSAILAATRFGSRALSFTPADVAIARVGFAIGIPLLIWLCWTLPAAIYEAHFCLRLLREPLRDCLAASDSAARGRVCLERPTRA